MRTIRLLTAAVLTVTALVVGVTTEAAQAASTSKTLTATPAKPMAGESLSLYGRTYGNAVRKIRLQYRNGSTWTNVVTRTSASDGSFSFTVTAAKSRTYRYYADKTATLAAVAGTPRYVPVAPQAVTDILVSNAKQCVDYPETITVLVRFTPARVGRDVVLTTPQGDIEGNEDFDGIATFQFTPVTGAGSYQVQATAEEFDGAPAIASRTVTYRSSSGYCN